MADEIGDIIASSESYTRPDRVHAMLTDLRREEPVRWTEPTHTRPFWLVTKHADIIELERQPEKFINGPRLELFTHEQEALFKKMYEGRDTHVRTILHMDGAEHRAYRGLAQGWFMASRLRALEASLKELAVEYVDLLAEKGGEADFVADLAVWYPLRVIMLILGLPKEEAPELLRLTRNFVGRGDKNVVGSDLPPEEILFRAGQDVFNYFIPVYQDRLQNPKDDLATVLAHAKIDGKPINNLEALSYYLLVGLAGHETTSASIAGGMLGLIDHPDQMDLLKKNLDMLTTAIEEMLRWSTPVHHFFRTATEDYELRGQSIKAGQSLMLLFYSGNRDEDVFADPFKFDIQRNPNPHIAFGYGAHVCLGQHLARMELKALFGELLTRLNKVERAGEPKWLAAATSGGITQLPIKYGLKAA